MLINYGLEHVFQIVTWKIQIRNLSEKWIYSYYRNNAEADLILESPANEIWAVEIKRSGAPVLKRSFHEACKDISATKKYVVYAGTEQFPMANDTEAIGLMAFLKLLK